MSPILIAAASLIPGLGFLLLGRWKSALLTWLFLIPFAALLFMTVDFQLRCLLLNIIWVAVIWAVQGVRAFRLAGIMEQLRRGEISLLNKVAVQDIRFDPRQTSIQRQHILFGKRMETHLHQGESLTDWIVGQSSFRDSFWGKRNVCVGLVESDLLICEFGVLDYPETIKRVRRADVQVFSGSYNSRNLVWIVEERAEKGKKSILLAVGSQYNQLLKSFNEHAHVQPMFKR